MRQVFRQHLGGKAGLFLIEIHCQQVELNRRAPLHVEQQIEQRVTVFSAGEAYHDPVAILDHAKSINGLAHAAEQSGLELCFYEHLCWATGCHAKS